MSLVININTTPLEDVYAVVADGSNFYYSPITGIFEDPSTLGFDYFAIACTENADAAGLYTASVDLQSAGTFRIEAYKINGTAANRDVDSLIATTTTFFDGTNEVTDYDLYVRLLTLDDVSQNIQNALTNISTSINNSSGAFGLTDLQDRMLRDIYNRFRNNNNNGGGLNSV